MGAYVFCLFFGPGRTLDLALSSTPSPSSLFVPVLGPGAGFWLTLSVGTSETSGVSGADGVLGSDLTPADFVFSFERVGVVEGGGGGFV